MSSWVMPRHLAKTFRPVYDVPAARHATILAETAILRPQPSPSRDFIMVHPRYLGNRFSASQPDDDDQ